MAAKQLRFEAPARAALARGAALVADTVAVTLGPRGRTVVLDKKFGPPLISNDGVTIAREIELEDHFENMGRAAAQGSGDQDQRHRRRRHHHRDGAGAGDARRGTAQPRRRRSRRAIFGAG